MSAPTFNENWREILESLQANWDSYGAKPISAAAIKTIGGFAAVPRTDGGIQLEIHRDGYDIEVEISPDGVIDNVLVAHEASLVRSVR